MSFEQTKINTNDKNKFYKLLSEQAKALLSVERNKIANAANLSALLFQSLEDINWVGFYFYIESQQELVLGPFQGQVACTRIPIGKGVCGTAFSQNEALRIKDVHAFDGHIACDTASNSEVVIPLNINGETIGVLDIDSPIFDRFDEADQNKLEEIAKIYCDSIR